MSDRLSTADAELALDIVDETIAAALAGRRPALPTVEQLPAALRRPAGAFVTLTVDGELNGCIGSIEAREPLGPEASRLALSAAFSDPRLPQLRRSDYPNLEIELSILSQPVPLPATSRADLIGALRPHIDGLIIETRSRRALFLPDVWDTLPDPDDFLDHLWKKAGLSPGTWPPDLRASSFTTETHRRAHRKTS